MPRRLLAEQKVTQQPSKQSGIPAETNLKVVTTPLHHLEHRPDIDGMRAIAVLSVVIFHLFPALLSGGFIGVDIFFVISGYLISSIIWNQLSKDSFSFSSFYARRIRRIFPTLLLVVLVTVIFGWLALLPAEFYSLVKSAKYTTLFQTNWYFYRSAGYFDVEAHLKPLLHLWSLSIEEQFYILYPLFLWGMYKLKNRKLVFSLTFLFILSIASNLIFLADHSKFVFYALPTRAWELLAGGLLAYNYHSNSQANLQNVSRPLANIASTLGLGLIIYACVCFSQNDPFPGWRAAFPVLGTCLLIVGLSSWINSYALSWKPVVWVGLISYSLYLWHWPMISFAHILNQEPSLSMRLGILVSSFILAALTTFLMEKPIRKAMKSWVYPLCIVMVAFGAVFSILATKSIETLPMLLDQDSRLAKFEQARKDWLSPSEHLTKFDARGFPFKSYGDGETVIAFFGDSNMKQYWPRIEKILSEDRNLRASHTAVFVEHSAQFPLPGYPKNKASMAFLENAHEFIFSDDVKIVVLCAQWISYDFPDKDPNANRVVDFKSMILKLIAQHKKVYVILNIPSSPNTDPMSRLDRGLFFARPSTVESFALQKHENKVGDSMARLRELAEDAGAIVIDPTETFCPGGQCMLLDKNGVPTYKDSGHITATFAKENAAFIDRIFKE